MLPPRINHALGINLKSFVLHDYSQQFAQDVFYGNTTFKNQTNKESSMFKHMLLQTLGFPIVSLCHILSKVGIGGPLRLCKDYDLGIPINKLMSHAASYIFFLALILLNILNPDDNPNEMDLNWYDYLTPLFALGFLFIDMEQGRYSVLS